MNKGRVLIVSYLFAPNNSIGAIRPTKIAAGLIQKGYEVDVVTYGASGNDSFKDMSNVTNKYVMNSSPKVPTNAQGRSAKKRMIKFGAPRYWLSRYNAAIRSLKAGYEFVRFFKRLYEKKLKNNNYDAVFTSFGPLASLQCGLFLKRQNPNIKWICDFRDPVVTLTPLLLRPYMQYHQDIACKKADIIVAVSKGYLKRICKNKYIDKAHLIPNGFDEDDLSNIAVDNEKKDVFKLVYAGALYSGKRDISPVFKVIRELLDEGLVEQEKISFEYAGSDYGVLADQAQAYNLQSIVRNNGMLSRDACLKLQKESDILVLATWNHKVEEGVFPGKFLEYMLINRPIVAVVSGDLPNSEVAQVVNSGEFGVCFEEAKKDTDYNTLKHYLKRQYEAFCACGETGFAPKEEIRNRYNYKNIVCEIEGLIHG